MNEDSVLALKISVSSSKVVTMLTSWFIRTIRLDIMKLSTKSLLGVPLNFVLDQF